VCAAPRGGYVLTSGEDHALRLWELSTGRCVGRLEGHACGVDSVCLSPDWQYALAAGRDGKVHVWEIDWELEGH
jgi:WD40 repeat protein